MLTAVGTLPLLNAGTHIASVQYSKAALPTSVHSSTWHSGAFVCHRAVVYMFESCSTLQIFITKQGHQDIDACKMCLHTPPSGDKIYKYLPAALKHL
jgi:hypothetical protein